MCIRDSYYGLVDEVAIWDRVLDSEFIKALSEGASPDSSNNLDQDEDGLPDWWETKYDVEDPNADPDNDGLTNLEEYELRTNPIEADTDSDGLSDGAEVALKSSPLISDTDNDGLNDKEENDIGTNPTKEDTDDDGFTDLKEVEAGSNPLNSNSIPPTPPAAEPLFFFDFEGDEGGIVIDKSQSGNDGEIITASAIKIKIDEGAPQGSSPGTSVQFDNGHINVPGVTLDEIIFEGGSYTMMSWLKPSDLNGEKFFFGQSVQGIHNGIRNNAFLHQAHWGADTNGATNLNGYLEDDEDGWIHATWTYDAENDIGQIYLDGQLDWEGAKRAPNGSGLSLIHISEPTRRRGIWVCGVGV